MKWWFISSLIWKLLQSKFVCWAFCKALGWSYRIELTLHLCFLAIAGNEQLCIAVIVYSYGEPIGFCILAWVQVKTKCKHWQMFLFTIQEDVAQQVILISGVVRCLEANSVCIHYCHSINLFTNITNSATVRKVRFPSYRQRYCNHIITKNTLVT